MSPIAYNKVEMPSFLYGTAWKKEDTARLVEMAVDSGFTGIDTANQMIHYNEVQVGDALLKLKEKGIKRENLFLQTKFTSINGQGNGTLPYDPKAPLMKQVEQSFESSLKHLHTDYLDSYVLHGPYYRSGLAGEDWEVWGAIEDLYAAGKTKMIGVSNVSIDQLEELCSKARTKPMAVQNRCYAVMGWDQEVREFCRANDIVYQGFSLLTANTRVLSEACVRSIASRLDTGVAQVVFKFAMQVGMLPLTGTTSHQRMKDDLEAEKLELTAADVKEIETSGLTANYS